jgi:hypothetical protein
MRDLKSVAVELSGMLNKDKEWFVREVSFVIDGSHNSGEATYLHILDVLDVSKKNLGKRNNNLVAFVGQQSIVDILDVNRQQALSVWHKLSNSDKATFDEIVRTLLIDLNSELCA